MSPGKDPGDGEFGDVFEWHEDGEAAMFLRSERFGLWTGVVVRPVEAGRLVGTVVHDYIIVGGWTYLGNAMPYATGGVMSYDEFRKKLGMLTTAELGDLIKGYLP